MNIITEDRTIDLDHTIAIVDQNERITMKSGYLTVDDLGKLLGMMGYEYRTIVPSNEDIRCTAEELHRVKDEFIKHGFDNRASLDIAVRYLFG